MTERKKSPRLGAVMRDLNVGLSSLVAFLGDHGFQVEESPTTKLEPEAYELILQEFGAPGMIHPVENAKTATKSTKKTGGDSAKKEKDPTTSVLKEEVVVMTTESERETKELPKVDLKIVGKVALPDATEEKTPLIPTVTPPSDTKKKQEAEEFLATHTPLEDKGENRIIENEKGSVEKNQKEASEIPIPSDLFFEDKEKTTEQSLQGETLGEDSSVLKTEDKPIEEESLVKGVEVKDMQAERESGENIGVVNDTLKVESASESQHGPKVVGKIDLINQPTKAGKRKHFEAKPEEKKPVEVEKESVPQESVDEQPVSQNVANDEQHEETIETEQVYRTSVTKLSGTKVVGKIDLGAFVDKGRRKPEVSATPGGGVQKHRRRKKVGSSEDVALNTSSMPSKGQTNTSDRQGQQQKGANNNNFAARDLDRRNKKKQSKKPVKPQEITTEQLEEKRKEVNARVAAHSAFASGVKYRKEKRSLQAARREAASRRDEEARKTLQVSEFVSINELAGLMGVPETELIEACMSFGLIVSITQRLDGDMVVLLADEFGYKVEFIGPTIENELDAQEDDPADLAPRIPIFTVLGHVDHGKTSLCNYLTKQKKKEDGDITQDITANVVELASGEKLVLVDTPGHEAFTAMRSRGIKIADVLIVVISAVEGVQPQTQEVINNALNNGVHIVFAINKIDMPDANPRRVLDELANMNILVEEYGGKYQCQEISAKHGTNVDKLLEKVLLEASVMDLKANPKRNADALVLEATVQKGVGSCVNVIVRNGTLKKGDRIVAGQFYGRVRALHIPGDDKHPRGVLEVPPSMPAMVMGLNGKPTAGDHLLVVDSDKEARDMATKIGRIRRLQEMNSRKPISFDEIGRRRALGELKTLNIILKADVDGSVEALADSLLKLSTEEVQIAVISKSVGQILPSDISLAETSDALIIGFQVRPSTEAKRMATEKNIDVHLYSVIYDAIEEVRQAMLGMLSPEIKEEVLGTAEVRETFRISKVGTIAGCIVREGKILRGSKVRIIRDGIVVYTSDLLSLKHYKDEAKEVINGQECGLSVKNYNDIKIGDLIEAFRLTEIVRTLD